MVSHLPLPSWGSSSGSWDRQRFASRSRRWRDPGPPAETPGRGRASWRKRLRAGAGGHIPSPRQLARGLRPLKGAQTPRCNGGQQNRRARIGNRPVAVTAIFHLQVVSRAAERIRSGSASGLMVGKFLEVSNWGSQQGIESSSGRSRTIRVGACGGSRNVGQNPARNPAGKKRVAQSSQGASRAGRRGRCRARRSLPVDLQQPLHRAARLVRAGRVAVEIGLGKTLWGQPINCSRWLPGFPLWAQATQAFAPCLAMRLVGEFAEPDRNIAGIGA